jgi:hypothetical protein
MEEEEEEKEEEDVVATWALEEVVCRRFVQHGYLSGI